MKPAIPTSRLYTFINDPDRDFALYFLEGQGLIHDLALVHPIRGAGFAYFRDVVLSIQPLIALLKHGEQLGFYIDSDRPPFRLKIETGHHGEMRCMLLPEDFAEFPEAMHGLVRVQTLFPRKRPYDSVLKIEGAPLRELVNRVLAESYQINSAMIVSQQSDQSLLLHQLPPLSGRESYDYSPQALEARRVQIRDAVSRIFARALSDPADIEAAFAEIGFRLLASRPVRFRCSCSRERLIQNLQVVHRRQGEQLFEPDQSALDIRCEYCKQAYRISKRELEHAPRPVQ